MKFTSLLLVGASALAYAQADDKSSELTERVSRMARVGSVSGPSFSPDGRWLSVISHIGGVPQVNVIRRRVAGRA
jgi:hypothetical protein